MEKQAQNPGSRRRPRKLWKWEEPQDYRLNSKLHPSLRQPSLPFFDGHDVSVSWFSCLSWLGSTLVKCWTEGMSSINSVISGHRIGSKKLVLVDVILIQNWKKELEELNKYLKSSWWKEVFAIVHKTLFTDTFSMIFFSLNLCSYYKWNISLND